MSAEHKEPKSNTLPPQFSLINGKIAEQIIDPKLFVLAIIAAKKAFCDDYFIINTNHHCTKMLKELYINAKSTADSSCNKFFSPVNPQRLNTNIHGITYNGSAQDLADHIKATYPDAAKQKNNNFSYLKISKASVLPRNSKLKKYSITAL